MGGVQEMKMLTVEEYEPLQKAAEQVAKVAELLGVPADDITSKVARLQADAKITNKQRKMIASVHNHMNIYAGAKGADDGGEVTEEEKREAINRQIKYHRRQITVHEELLVKMGGPH